MASRRKGLSLEEKRQKMMELFYEKKDFYQLKELEKMAPKEKGIVSQSVKDVVQSLVDDGMIDTDKIGTSVYFWAFPSKALSTRKRKLGDLEQRLNESSKRLKSTETKLEQSQLGREEGEDRAQILVSLSELEAVRDKLLLDLQKYKDCDPEVLEQMKKDTKTALEATNRWTENIFSIKSWCQKKFNMEEKTLNKQFGIPEDLDYV